MLAIVIIFNFLISLLCLYIAWRVWHLRQVLAATTDMMIAAERSVHKVLKQAPDAIAKGEMGAYRLQKIYQRLELQIKQVQQVLMLLGLVNSVGRLTFHYTSTGKASPKQKHMRRSHKDRYPTERSHHTKRYRNLRKR